MQKPAALLCLIIFGCLLPVSASPLSRAGAGGGLTFGTHGFRGLSLYGDAEWTGKTFLPYAWADFTDNSFVNQFSFGGGAWRDWASFAAKAGLGLAFGQDAESEDSLESFTLEAGVQKYFWTFRAGADYRLTRGTLSGTRYSGSANEELSTRRRRPATTVTATTEVDAFTTHELSAFLGHQVGPGWLQGRLALAKFPGENVTSQTVSWSLPVTPSLRLIPAVTLEQGPVDRAYVSGAAYWDFDFKKTRRKP